MAKFKIEKLADAWMCWLKLQNQKYTSTWTRVKTLKQFVCFNCDKMLPARTICFKPMRGANKKLRLCVKCLSNATELYFNTRESWER